MEDARAAGFTTREAYAAMRRHELDAALDMAGIASDRRCSLDFIDKDTYLHLSDLVARLTLFIAQLGPAIVLSPAYEGGHPDHDSTAFAVAVARGRVDGGFVHREYRLYHAGPDERMHTEDFLPDDRVTAEIYLLSPAERATKAEMLACFETQAHVVSLFQTENELFRDAPRYDFTRPPHEGPLLYERWGWPISGAEWRRRAREVTVTDGSSHAYRRPIFGSDMSWRPQHHLRNRM